MSRKTVKVEIPNNPDDLLLLLGKVIAKNAADGADSPIKSLNMTTFEAKTTIAATANAEMQRLYDLAKIETGKRDNAFGTMQTEDTVLYILGQIRDMLLAIYKNNPRELGQWGFDVVEGEVTLKRATTAKKAPEA